MNRRSFTASSATAAAVAATGFTASAQTESAPPFNLMYAPGFRHFANSAGKEGEQRLIQAYREVDHFKI